MLETLSRLDPSIKVQTIEFKNIVLEIEMFEGETYDDGVAEYIVEAFTVLNNSRKEYDLELFHNIDNYRITWEKVLALVEKIEYIDEHFEEEEYSEPEVEEDEEFALRCNEILNDESMDDMDKSIAIRRLEREYAGLDDEEDLEDDDLDSLDEFGDAGDDPDSWTED
jgi:hypothetical protein